MAGEAARHAPAPVAAHDPEQEPAQAPAQVPAHVPVILLMGPTASGKSGVAMALSRRLPVEIISMDSAQVYRGMDVGTAKPGAAERAAVAHHLIDLVVPTEAYSAARFRADALEAIAAVRSRGRLPMVVGGTMLYARALQFGLSSLPPADEQVRAALDARAAVEGWPSLHAELARLDPVAAARLAPNDAQRIQRALEVHAITGQPMSALLAVRQDSPPPYAFLPVALLPSDRLVLHERIAQRFDAMLAAGLVDELRALRQRHALQPAMPSMRCVGYRQAWEHLEGAIDAQALRERGIFATRQLAKRQLTWLRSMPGLKEVDCLSTDSTERVLGLLEAEGALQGLG
jgi:tRNA dimethylallyltransferase